jgi:hypothetical protein
MILNPFRDGEEAISIAELCRRADLHAAVPHRWIQKGWLPAMRYGGKVAITRKAWDAFLNRETRPSPGSVSPQGRSLAQRRRDDEAAAKRCRALGC